MIFPNLLLFDEKTRGKARSQGSGAGSSDPCLISHTFACSIYTLILHLSWAHFPVSVFDRPLQAHKNCCGDDENDVQSKKRGKRYHSKQMRLICARDACSTPSAA